MRASLFLRAAALKLQTMTPVHLIGSGGEAVARLGRRSRARNAPGDLRFSLGASRKCGTQAKFISSTDYYLTLLPNLGSLNATLM